MHTIAEHRGSEEKHLKAEGCAIITHLRVTHREELMRKSAVGVGSPLSSFWTSAINAAHNHLSCWQLPLFTLSLTVIVIETDI